MYWPVMLKLEPKRYLNLLKKILNNEWYVAGW